MLYFIRSGQYVKIGVSATPWKRFASLQVGNPEPLEMLAIIPGDTPEEAQLHALYASLHVKGEWFLLAPEIEEKIAPHRVQGQGSAHQATPGSSDRGQPRLPRRRVWIEFRQKNGRRYARRRTWKKVDGHWKKLYLGRVTDIPAMTEDEYQQYTLRHQLAKRIRALHEAGRGKLPPGIHVIATEEIAP